MMIPTVHLNGTSWASLIAQIESAVNAIDKALEAISDASPNGRDYYPQGDSAFKKALIEHESRLHRLREIKNEYHQIWDELQ